MRKDPHSKEGGTGRIKVMYLVIWSQGMPMSQKEGEESESRERWIQELRDRPQERLAPKLFMGRVFFVFVLLLFLRRIMDK